MLSSKSNVYHYMMVVLGWDQGRKSVLVKKVAPKKIPRCIYDNLDEFCGIVGKIINNNATKTVRKMTIVGL